MGIFLLYLREPVEEEHLVSHSSLELALVFFAGILEDQETVGISAPFISLPYPLLVAFFLTFLLLSVLCKI